jgi:GR25 family glycosyltransferase involved in LPS biosynthesis
MSVVYYINLDYRTDRRSEIEDEITDLPYPKHRISAIHTPGFGAIGCSLSHIRALETFLESEYDYCYIFEDDFKFIRPVSDIVLPSEWDVVMLSGNAKITEPFDEVFDRAMRVWAPSGYLVHRNFAGILLDNLKEGAELLQISYEQTRYSLDVYWEKLQVNSKWYIFKDKFGLQRRSWSDIENWVADYKV